MMLLFKVVHRVVSAIRSRRKQVIMIGDSLMRETELRELAGYEVQNFAIPGSRLSLWLHIGPLIARVTRARIVILGIGINDCIFSRQQDPAIWREQYVRLLDRLGRTKVVAAPILMVEADSLMAPYFDMALRGELSAIVSQEAMKTAPAFDPTGETNDGLHLSPGGKLLMRKALELACDQHPALI